MLLFGRAEQLELPDSRGIREPLNIWVLVAARRDCDPSAHDQGTNNCPRPAWVDSEIFRHSTDRVSVEINRTQVVIRYSGDNLTFRRHGAMSVRSGVDSRGGRRFGVEQNMISILCHASKGLFPHLVGGLRRPNQARRISGWSRTRLHSHIVIVSCNYVSPRNGARTPLRATKIRYDC